MSGSNIHEYSLSNAQRFGWSSLCNELPSERTDLLDQKIVGNKVLDAGCGGGGYVEYLVKKGLDAAGIDKFDFFVEQANRRGLEGRIHQADLCERLPFADKTFDTTICFDVLEHVDDQAAIRELARVTRARLILTMPQEDRWLPRYNLAFGHYRDPTHLRYYTPEMLHKLLQSVHPKHFEIQGESEVALGRLIQEMAVVRSRYPFLSTIYTRVFRFLSKRTFTAGVFQNLLAIVDLA